MLSVQSLYEPPLTPLMIFENDNIYDQLITEGLLLSPEYIKSLKLKVDFNKFKKFLDSKQKSILKTVSNAESKLIEHNIDISKLKKLGTKYAKIASEQIKNNKFNFKETTNLLIKEFNSGDMFKQLILLGKSFIIFAVVVAINSYLHILCIILFGPLGHFVWAVVCAPIVEETAKVLSIEQNMTGHYLVLFNVLEFSKYVVQIIGSGISLPIAILIRIPAILMHTFTTYLHVEAHKTNDANIKKKTLYLGILFHSLFNGPISILIAKAFNSFL